MPVSADVAEIYEDALALLGATAIHNGIEKPCLNAAIAPKLVTETVGYFDEASANLIMLRADYDAWEIETAKGAEIELDGDTFLLMDEPRRSAVHPLVRLALIADS